MNSDGSTQRDRHKLVSNGKHIGAQLLFVVEHFYMKASVLQFKYFYSKLDLPEVQNIISLTVLAFKSQTKDFCFICVFI